MKRPVARLVNCNGQRVTVIDVHLTAAGQQAQEQWIKEVLETGWTLFNPKPEYLNFHIGGFAAWSRSVEK